ncbi:hypothetical protein QBC38DRAFT_448930 [Podospora fimiseda]|uniref:Uncharacterized protein n=1 Tax=Podospora fimiseda TaxID=252190 RepID=A0AAN7BF74_9PEZI|nr:hypothetical protein QBC38DRAFT_448930 [Podospora fimiseda]
MSIRAPRRGVVVREPVMGLDELGDVVGGRATMLKSAPDRMKMITLDEILPRSFRSRRGALSSRWCWAGIGVFAGAASEYSIVKLKSSSLSSQLGGARVVLGCCHGVFRGQTKISTDWMKNDKRRLDESEKYQMNHMRIHKTGRECRQVDENDGSVGRDKRKNLARGSIAKKTSIEAPYPTSEQNVVLYITNKLRERARRDEVADLNIYRAEHVQVVRVDENEYLGERLRLDISDENMWKKLFFLSFLVRGLGPFLGSLYQINPARENQEVRRLSLKRRGDYWGEKPL